MKNLTLDLAVAGPAQAKNEWIQAGWKGNVFDKNFTEVTAG